MFNKRLGFRIEPKLKEEIKEIVRKNKHRYESPSQFIRVAIIKLINESKEGLNESRRVRVIRE